MERGVPIRAVSRSIAVLQSINRGGSLSLKEIAHAVDLPYPTAFRIIQTLIFEGLIECEPARKHYRATPLVQSLSRGYCDGGRLIAAARPRMVALTHAVSWPVSVATHVGKSMMVRDSTHTLTSLTFSNYMPGYTLPLLECASGHAYLAHVSDEERAALLAGIEAFESRSQMVELFKNERLVRNIRENGYATCQRNPHTADPGKTSSIGVPIFDGGKVTAALTLVFFASAMTMHEAVRRYVEPLKEAARDISRVLATPPDEATAAPARSPRREAAIEARPRETADTARRETALMP